MQQLVLAHGGHNELESAASSVDVLLAPARVRLSGRAAVLSPAAGQGDNSKAVTLKSSLTQSCQPAEGLEVSGFRTAKCLISV